MQGTPTGMQRIYYGWVIVALSVVSLTASYGLLFSYGVFIPFLAEDLGLDRATAAAPFSVSVAVYASLSLVTGRLTDRLGPRRIMLVGGGALALGYATIGAATEAWHLIVSMGLITGIGMSTAYIPTSATIVRWFVQRRGLALALSGMGLSASMAAGPLVAVQLIEGFGWRTALIVMGLLGGGLVFVCALGFRRDPDVSLTAAPNPQSAHLPDEPSWTLREARRTSAFWVLSGVFLLSWAVMFFPYAHLPSIAVDLGYSHGDAAGMLVALGGGGLVGRPLIGWFSDRTDRKMALALLIVIQILALAMLLVSQSLPALYAAAALFGVGASTGVTLFPAVIGDTFGRAHVGAISGFIFAITCTAGAIGPLAAGWVRDETGSYMDAFWIGIAVNGVAAALVLCLRPPTPPAVLAAARQ